MALKRGEKHGSLNRCVQGQSVSFLHKCTLTGVCVLQALRPFLLKMAKWSPASATSRSPISSTGSQQQVGSISALHGALHTPSSLSFSPLHLFSSCCLLSFYVLCHYTCCHLPLPPPFLCVLFSSDCAVPALHLFG